MSDQTAQEPTMEEILASIRRIISEDDAPPAQAAAPEPVFAPAPVEPEEEDVLELTDAIEAAAPLETHGDIDVYEPMPEPETAWAPEPEPAPVFSAPEPEPEPYVPPPQPSYSAPAQDDDLIGSAAAAATASAFGRLEAALSMPAPGRSLDDVVRELLKPLLKQWLDENLPRIAEAKVAEAVEKLQRGRV
jgi:cell pole-organizing protein PopZ